jgi:hypothetical protein
LSLKMGYDAATDNFDFRQFGQLDVRGKGCSMRSMGGDGAAIDLARDGGS